MSNNYKAAAEEILDMFRATATTCGLSSRIFDNKTYRSLMTAYLMVTLENYRIGGELEGMKEGANLAVPKLRCPVRYI